MESCGLAEDQAQTPLVLLVCIALSLPGYGTVRLGSGSPLVGEGRETKIRSIPAIVITEML
jgi:hypothetical protein